MINLPKTDAQWLPEMWNFMLDPLFETFLTSNGLNSLRPKGCHILEKIMIFKDPFLKKNTTIGYYGASDDLAIRIRKFFGEIGL